MKTIGLPAICWYLEGSGGLFCLVFGSKTAMAAKPSLKSLLRKGELLVAPGVFDGISTRLADEVGFQALYMTGRGIYTYIYKCHISLY